MTHAKEKYTILCLCMQNQAGLEKPASVPSINLSPIPGNGLDWTGAQTGWFNIEKIIIENKHSNMD